jgi:hypothetical protein
MIFLASPPINLGNNLQYKPAVLTNRPTQGQKDQIFMLKSCSQKALT